MSNKVISMEIGLHTTRICEVSYKKNNPHVYQCISFQTPENTFEDGYIRDKNKFVDTVKEKISEAKFKSNRIVFTVASNKIASREVTIPLVKENRIQDVVNANATEYFPIDLSEYTISYSVLEKVTDKDDRKLRLLVLAAPNNLIRNYYNVAEMLGCEVAAIDYMGNSNLQIIKKQVSEGTNMVLQVNEQMTLISILEKNVLKLQRTISFGTVDIVEALVNDRNFGSMSEQEAYQLLQQMDFNDIQSEEMLANKTPDMNKEEPKDSKVSDDYYSKSIIIDSLSYLVNNILRILDYYVTQNQKNVETILITGNGSKIPAIEQLIKQETRLEIQGLNELNSVTFNKRYDIKKEDQSEYIFCIGASINPVNFIPNEDILKKKKHLFIHNMYVIFIGSCIFSLILVGSAYLSYHTELQVNKKLKADIDKIAGVEEIYNRSIKLRDVHEQVQELEKQSSNPNEKLNQLIKDLEDKLPNSAVVEAVNITSSDITLSMKTDSKETAAKVLQQLKTIPSLSEVTTNGITESRSEVGVTTVKFVINARYDDLLLQEGDDNE
ncbi:MAG: pilus assembly protein PilM [Clostridiales bacterium]|nr:pilus assembly protein PilM [Clostridiales bacterium]